MSKANNPSSTVDIKLISTLYLLTLESILAKNKDELIFRILNRTILLTKYDRAVLWQRKGQSAKVLGISGVSKIEKRSVLHEQWKQLIPEKKDWDVSTTLKQAGDTYSQLAATTKGLEIIWLPFKTSNNEDVALWLERWEGNKWSENEIKLLNSLITAYGGAWQKISRPSFFSKLASSLSTKRTALLFFFVIILLSFIKVPLRAVAPCEIAPKEPVVVTAPLNGILKDVEVSSGEMVKPGDVLFTFDSRVADRQLDVSKRQIEILESKLERIEYQSFQDASLRAEIEILNLELELERVKVQQLTDEMKYLVVRSDIFGQVIVDNQASMKGKPVSMGEQILFLVDPDKVKLDIRIPEQDNIIFDPENPIKVVLNAFPGKPIDSKIDFISPYIQQGSDGIAFQAAEASLAKMPEARIGFKGTVILYGEKVYLWYWLLRRPISSIRNFMGL